MTRAAEGADTAYFSLGAGFLRTPLADGATLERVLLPEQPLWLRSVPGVGKRVLAVVARRRSVQQIVSGMPALLRARKPEIDQERIEAHRGTVPLPFELGEHRRIAVKIVIARGIESLMVLDIPDSA